MSQNSLCDFNKRTLADIKPAELYYRANIQMGISTI